MNNETELTKLLQAWRVTPRDDPHFRHRVWDRIASATAAESSSIGHRVRNWFTITLPQPIYASVFVFTVVASGLWLTNLTLSRAQDREMARLEERYFASINPIVMARESMRAPR